MVGIGPGHAVTATDRQEDSITGSQDTVFWLARDAKSCTSSQYYDQFGLFLVVPEPLMRRLPERDDALETNPFPSE
jgi:hypothetical protein